jgi:hypothetical protein
VEYDQERRPRVTVVDPPLQRHDGQQLPHVFPGDDLCLYYDEFDGGQHLIATRWCRGSASGCSTTSSG